MEVENLRDPVILALMGDLCRAVAAEMAKRGNEPKVTGMVVTAVVERGEGELVAVSEGVGPRGFVSDQPTAARLFAAAARSCGATAAAWQVQDDVVY